MKYLLLIVLLFSQSCSYADNRVNQYWKYINTFIGDEFLISKSEKLIHHGPYAEPLEFCGGGEYICFSHPEYWFAIPVKKDKKKLKIGDQWKYDNKRYCVVETRTGEGLFEKTGRLYIIYSTMDKECKSGMLGISRYIYSYDKGLIMMEFFRDENGRELLSLSQKRGFGAQ